MGTGYFTKGTTFATGGQVAATTLHQLVEDATLNPAHFTGLPAKTATVGADRIMATDSENGNALVQVTLANLLPASSVRASKIYTAEEFVFQQVRVQYSTAHGWVWMNGGSNNLILQETTSAGAALAPAKIPVVIAEGTASETLRMDANGISVKTNAAPTAALDVNGRVISTNFLVKGSAPKLVFHDTVTSGIVVGAVYMDASELLFGSLDNVTTMGGVSTPLRLSLLPGADGALVIASDKKATFGGDVTVTGSVTCAGAFYLGPTSTPAGTSDGYNGQVSWDTNYLYVCTTTGTGGAGRWKRVALSSF